MHKERGGIEKPPLASTTEERKRILGEMPDGCNQQWYLFGVRHASARKHKRSCPRTTPVPYLWTSHTQRMVFVPVELSPPPLYGSSTWERLIRDPVHDPGAADRWWALVIMNFGQQSIVRLNRPGVPQYLWRLVEEFPKSCWLFAWWVPPHQMNESSQHSFPLKTATSWLN